MHIALQQVAVKGTTTMKTPTIHSEALFPIVIAEDELAATSKYRQWRQTCSV
jgi:hypothetical protein